jgi:tripartite-type tricarboxylate transporter receptor subunit TctC
MRLKSALLTIAALVAVTIMPLGATHAQGTSGQPIKILVGFGAGGVTDVIARIFADELKPKLNRTIIVENRPGASGTIATRQAAEAAPDGDTLIMIPGTHTIIPAMRKLPYDPVNGLAAVTLIASAPNLLVVRSDSPYKTLDDLIKDAKAHPGTLGYASSGVGTTVHFMGIMLETQAGITLNHVPFKSSGESVQAVLGGHIPMSFSALNQALPQIKAGKLRALAIATAKRSSSVPDVPTFDEAGVSGIRSDTWIGLAAPAKTPAKIIKTLDENVQAIMKTPAVDEKIKALGADPVGLGPSEFQALIKDEIEKFETLARKAKLKREG